MSAQTDPQYKLRLPPELHTQLKQAAAENHRSMNAEMVARLQDSFRSSQTSRISGVVPTHKPVVGGISPAMEEYLTSVIEKAYSNAIEEISQRRTHTSLPDDSNES